MPVVAVTESQEIDAAGNLTNVFELTYTIPDRPGSFTLTVARQADAVQEAIDKINELTAQVGSIYAIP